MLFPHPANCQALPLEPPRKPLASVWHRSQCFPLVISCPPFGRLSAETDYFRITVTRLRSIQCPVRRAAQQTMTDPRMREWTFSTHLLSGRVTVAMPRDVPEKGPTTGSSQQVSPHLVSLPAPGRSKGTQLQTQKGGTSWLSRNHCDLGRTRVAVSSAASSQPARGQ